MIQTLHSNDLLSLTREPAEAFFAESGIDGELNFDHFCAKWGQLIDLDIAVVMVYLDAHNRPRGIIGGTITQCLMTADMIAQEAFWWIAPELRASPAGVRLFKFWEQRMILKGAKRIYVGNLHAVNHDKMADLYARLGYKPLETHYVRST